MRSPHRGRRSYGLFASAIAGFCTFYLGFTFGAIGSSPTKISLPNHEQQFISPQDFENLSVSSRRICIESTKPTMIKLTFFLQEKHDMMLAVVSHYTANKIEKWWLDSLTATGFSGRVVILHDGTLTTSDIASLKAKGAEVVLHLLDEYGKPIATQCTSKLKSTFRRAFAVCRFWMAYHYLSLQSPQKVRYVIFTDVKDVYFQVNPSVWLQENMNGAQLVAASEAVKFQHEKWAWKRMQENFGEFVAERFKGNTIWNAGVIAGTLQTMTDLSLNIYLASMSRESGEPKFFRNG